MLSKLNNFLFSPVIIFQNLVIFNVCFYHLLNFNVQEMLWNLFFFFALIQKCSLDFRVKILTIYLKKFKIQLFHVWNHSAMAGLYRGVYGNCLCCSICMGVGVLIGACLTIILVLLLQWRVEFSMPLLFIAV